MLFEPDRRILISADALWQNGFGAIFPEIEGEGRIFGTTRIARSDRSSAAPAGDSGTWLAV